MEAGNNTRKCGETELEFNLFPSPGKAEGRGPRTHVALLSRLSYTTIMPKAVKGV